MFAMSGDGNDDVTIPVVFLFSKDKEKLLAALKKEPNLKVSFTRTLQFLILFFFFRFLKVNIMNLIELQKQLEGMIAAKIAKAKSKN